MHDGLWLWLDPPHALLAHLETVFEDVSQLPRNSTMFGRAAEQWRTGKDHRGIAKASMGARVFAQTYKNLG